MSEEKNNMMTRRKFLEGSALVTSGVVLGPLLSACARPTPTDTPGASPTSQEPAATTTGSVPSGGHLKVGIIGFPATWDVALGVNQAFRLGKNVMDPLVFISEQISPVPGLATNWESPDGGTTWEFQLREATWHDGKPFTSEDVKAHYDRLLDPDTGSAGATVFEMVESIDAPDSHFVRFHLKSVDVEFPIRTGQYLGPIQAAHIDPAAYGNEAMVGTGPFKWDDFVPGESIHLVKNPDYWMEDLPLLDRLTFINFEDETARINALQSGAIDIAPGIPKELIDVAERQADIILSESIPAAMVVAALRADQPPGNDPRVVEALKISLDREALVQTALGGHGMPTPDNPIPPGSPSYVDVGIPTRDVDRARSLLEEAGYEDGLDLELLVGVGLSGGVKDLALGIQDMAGQAGFNISVVMVPTNVYIDRWLTKTFGLTDWSPRPTLDAQFRVSYTCGAPWNETHWCDEEFDRMLDEARATADPDKRAELQAELQRYFAEYATAVIPYHFPLIAAHRTKVQNVQEHPMLGYTDFRSVAVGAG
ncbi:MAG: ABC transporter substrate-binding protein [bacterium]